MMRTLQQTIPAQAAQDGAGVKINRLGGAMLQRLMNPFLMVDEINSDNANDYLAGLPEHPHRGFETITYMKSGKMKHRDHMGNEEVIGSGDVQWMTAGRGVLHSEMPEQESGLLHGFQIWLNLPAAEKMKPAEYQELLKNEIATHEFDDNIVRVMAGELAVDQGTLVGPMQGLTTQPLIADVALSANKAVNLNFTSDNQVMVFVYSGSTEELASKHLGVYSAGETLEIKAGSEGAGFLVLSGEPIHEPIVQYGPFVMNSREEIEQALKDFQSPVFLESLTA